MGELCLHSLGPSISDLPHKSSLMNFNAGVSEELKTLSFLLTGPLQC